MPKREMPDGAGGNPLAGVPGVTAREGPRPSLPLEGRAPSSSPLLYSGALLAGAAVGLAVWYLTDALGQPAHRVVKMMVGALVIALFLSFPRIIPFALLLALPVYVLLPVSPIPFLNATNVLVGIALGMILFGGATSTRPHERLPGVWMMIIAFMVITVFSYFRGWAVPPAGSEYYAAALLKKLWLLIASMLTFVPFYYWIKTGKAARGALIVLIVALALGGLQCLRESEGARIGFRVTGGLGDVNCTAAFQSTALWFVLPLLFRKGTFSFRVKILLSVLVAIASMALWLPNSRGAMVAFAASGLIYFLLVRPKWVVPYLACLVLIWFIVPNDVRMRLSTTYEGVVDSEAGYETVNEDSGGRLDLWRGTVDIVLGNPILGVGFGNVPVALREEIDRYKASHNVYLQIAAEAGIPALIMWVSLLVGIIVIGVKLISRATDPLSKAIGEGAFVATVSLLIVNLFGDRFFHFSIASLVMFIAAISARALAGFSRSGSPD